MKSISSDYLKIILVLLFIYLAQSAIAAEKCALSHQLTDSSKKIHCLDKFDFSKRKYDNFNIPLDRAVRGLNCWSLAIPNETSCNNIIGFSARDPLWCMDREVRAQNKKSALSMCEAKGCKCSLVIDANDIVDTKLFFSYAMRETELVVHDNTKKEAKESVNNKSDLNNSQSEKNQSIINAEKEKQAQQDLKLAQDLKAIEDVKAKAQQELKLAQEAKAREDAISEARQKAQQELKLAQEAQAREDAISEARQKAQQELRQSQDAEARAAALEKLKQEEYQKEKQSAAAKARVLEEIKAEAYAKEKAILEAKAKAQADLKAEEIAKIQAEEQAKAQAIIDEKNRVAAAKAAVEQAKKNREQEIAEEKTKIAESQKKIEELKNKPLDIENSKLDKQQSKSASKKNAEETISETQKVGMCAGYHIFWYLLSLKANNNNDATFSEKIWTDLDMKYKGNPEYNDAQSKSAPILTKAFESKNVNLIKSFAGTCQEVGLPIGQNTKYEKSDPLPENEFPYFAIIRCYPKNQPEIRHLMFTPCFAGGSNFTTDLEITNGKEYGLYSGYSVQNQIAKLGTVSQEGVKILLRKEFKISAQNAHGVYMLNIAIYDAKTNNIIEQKSASLYGFIGFRN